MVHKKKNKKTNNGPQEKEQKDKQWSTRKRLPVQSETITTKVVILKPAHGEVYSIQHYVIKFVSDLRQVGGFLWVFRFPTPIKLK
jgi:hypothetical protein